jgi:hypothetical protein
MSDELIEHYLDREKFGSDTDFAIAEIKKFMDAFNAARAARVNISTSNTTKGTTTAIEEGIKANARMVESQKAVEAVVRQRFATEAKLVTIQTDYHKQTVANNLEIQKTNRELKTSIELRDAENGSIDKARARIKQLTAERNSLNLFTKAGQDRLKDLNAEIDKNNEFIKKNADAALKQKLNIGNYSGAVNVLKDSLTDVSKKIKDLTDAGKGQTDLVKSLQREEDLLNKILSTQEAGFANATAEVKANQKALLELQAAGLEGSEAFKLLAKQTGELQDQVADLRETTKNLGSDTFVFDGMIAAAQGLAGIYGVAEGAAALFGKENEELQKTFVKLQAIMTVIQGLQAVSNALQKEGAAMLFLNSLRAKAAAAAQTLYAFATNASTTAMKGFRVALLATGIGAILVLLASAANAMNVFGDSTDDASKSVDDFKESLDKSYDALQKNIDNIDHTIERTKALNKLRFGDENARKLADDEAELSGELSKQSKLNAELAKQTKARTELDKIANAERLKAGKATFDDLENLRKANISSESFLAKYKAVNDEVLKLEAEAEAQRQKNSNLSLNQSGDRKDAERKAVKEAADKAAADAKTRRDKALQEAKENLEKERKAQFESIKMQIEERKRMFDEAANDESRSLETRLNARADAQKAEQELLLGQKNFDLGNTKLTATEKQNIEDKYQLDSAASLREFLEGNTALIIAAGEKDLEAIKEASDKIKEAREKVFKNKQADISSRAVQALLTLNASLLAEEITRKEYDKRRKEIDRIRRREELELELAKLQSEKAALILHEDDITAKNAEIVAKELELSDLARDRHIENEEEKLQASLKRLEQIQSFSQEVFSVVSGFVNASATREKNELRELMDEREKKAAREIELINASALSEQDKAAKIQIVNARLAAQKEENDRRQRAADEKRARFEKAMSIFNIVLSTSIAVIRALTEGDVATKIPRAIAAGVMGAAQLAVAIATPIPKYKYGRGKGKDEIAIVDDGGVSEPILRGNGTIEYSGSAIPRLTHLKADDIVLPDLNSLVNISTAGAMRNIQVPVQTGIDKGDLDNHASRIERAVGQIQTHNTVVTKDGWAYMNKRLAEQEKWINTVIKN